MPIGTQQEHIRNTLGVFELSFSLIKLKQRLLFLLASKVVILMPKFWKVSAPSTSSSLHHLHTDIIIYTWKLLFTHGNYYLHVILRMEIIIMYIK